MPTLTFLLLAGATGLQAAPSLQGTWGVGAGAGAQRYQGTYGDEISFQWRAQLEWAPLEWLGTRARFGMGDLRNESGAEKEFKTEQFSNLGLDLVLRPRLWDAPLRPFLATGLSSTFGSAVTGSGKEDLDANLYVPAEAGIEFLLSSRWSVWAYGQTYLWMDRYDRIDGLSRGSNYSDRRDEWYQAGLGITLRFGGFSDHDRDGVEDSRDRCPNSAPGLPVDSTGCPLDADRDGVPDSQDKCPFSPRGIKVDGAGCPLDSDQDGVVDPQDKCPGTAPGTKVDANGCTADADHDGVSDQNDRCPGTPPDVAVDPQGCSLDTDRDGIPDALDRCPQSLPGAKVDASGCVPDADHDGVPDGKDHCPATPSGWPVDPTGCPLDSDGDGVLDGLDKCPGTPKGQVVDALGCPVVVLQKGTKLTLTGIVFKAGSAQIDASSAATLQKAADAILNSPDAKIEIAGFTDNKGKEAANRTLSQKRAESVKAWLAKLKVPAARLTAKGYGSQEPVAPNDSEEGRSKNRRIEFRIK